MKNILFNIFAIASLIIMGFFAFLYITSPKVWYAGSHDSHCEGGKCHCYERLVEAEK